VAALVVILFGLVLLWLYSRYRVTLGENTLAYRKVLREHVIRYGDITSVAYAQSVVATGRSVTVIVLLRLGLVGRPKPLDIQLTLIPERERAIIVHRLQEKAAKASFSPDLHRLWTGAF
jgi:hypothetical protein